MSQSILSGLTNSHWWFIIIGVGIYFCMVGYTSKLNMDNMGYFNLYLQVGTLTIFIINLMLTLDNYRQQIEDRHKSYYLKYGNISQIKLNDIDKMFFSTPLLTRLYLEMYSSDPHVEKIKRLMKDPINESPELLKAEHHASSIIYQTMAGIYMTGLTDRDGQFSCEDLVEWHNTFKKWLQSPILRRHWITLQDEHHPKFRYFIDQILKPGLTDKRYYVTYYPHGLCFTSQKKN